MKNFRFLSISVILLIFFTVITFSSLLNVYEKKEKIFKFISLNLGISNSDKNYSYKIKKKDIYWANEILNGGYILHFRHAERDKWIDLTMYDALESDVHNRGLDSTRYAENDYFSGAVCLNERGKVQARAMGEHIQKIGLPIGLVVSSVSCRARQTAELAFGGYNGTVQVGNTESWNGTSWTEVNDMNTSRYTLAGDGIQTSALGFSAFTTVSLASTESWNGSNWTNENDLNTARSSLGGAGTASLGLAFAGDASPITTATEEWYGDGKVTDVIQSS